MYSRKGYLAVLAALLVILASTGCNGSSNVPNGGARQFAVTISNVAPSFSYLVSGVFNTPVGAGGPGPATNGNSFEFDIAAAPGMNLSFATMFGQSNDLFFGPDGDGIALFDSGGTPISGDVSDQVYLWDAGTEENQEPGMGDNQAPRQAAPDTGPADPNNAVRLVNDGFTYPAVTDAIKVTVTPTGGNEFTVNIACTTDVTPLSPGVYVVHSDPNPLFTEGSPDYGDGLERIAEDGNPTMLGDTVGPLTGLATPLSPGVWVVANGGAPLFTSGSPDYGDGLEQIAEAGNPTTLGSSIAGGGFADTGVFNTPTGAGSAGPITPGNSYSFTIEGAMGDYLSFASMFGQSNDIFLAPGQSGIALFDAGGTPISGDITSQLSWWDCGTEANQFPGAGPDQAPRQSAPDAGAPDPNTNVRVVNDGYSYLPVTQMVSVTITPL